MYFFQLRSETDDGMMSDQGSGFSLSVDQDDFHFRPSNVFIPATPGQSSQLYSIRAQLLLLGILVKKTQNRCNATKEILLCPCTTVTRKWVKLEGVDLTWDLVLAVAGIRQTTFCGQIISLAAGQPTFCLAFGKFCNLFLPERKREAVGWKLVGLGCFAHPSSGKFWSELFFVNLKHGSFHQTTHPNKKMITVTTSRKNIADVELLVRVGGEK